jgi:hypothetical protein
MTRIRQPRAFLFRQGQPFATVAGARAACARYAVALSAHFGYPKQPTEADVTRVGGGIHVPLSEMRWTWWTRVRRLPDGAALILDVAHPAIAALDGAVLPVPVTYDGRTVPGGGGTVTIDLSRGVEIGDDVLDAAEEDPT